MPPIRGMCCLPPSFYININYSDNLIVSINTVKSVYVEMAIYLFR